MRKKMLWVICLAVLLLLAANVYAGSLAVDWWAIGPASQSMSAGDLQVMGMVGQAAAGEISAGSVNLCVGYLCLPLTQVNLYLPLILK